MQFKPRYIAGLPLLAFLTVFLMVSDPLQAKEAAGDAKETVMLYGQRLHPGQAPLWDSDYTWKDLKHLVPQLLPDSRKSQLSADETCSHVVKLAKLYIGEAETATGALMAVLKPTPEFQPADPQLPEKLASKSPKSLDLLMRIFPNDQAKVTMAKSMTLNALTMAALHDAALANCPEYAQEKGYIPLGKTAEYHEQP